MGVNREELKRIIDHIPEQDAVEVLDFIGYLFMKRERETAQYIDVEALSEDVDLIQQIQRSREDRKVDRIYDQQEGLEYLRVKMEDFERGQSL
jgi:aspartate carbamoyltransferase regulatory subunit